MARDNQDDYAEEGRPARFLRTFLGLGRDDLAHDRASGSGDGEKGKKGLFWSPFEREGRTSPKERKSNPEPERWQPERSQPVYPQTTSRFQRPPAASRSGSGNGEPAKPASYSQGGAKAATYSTAAQADTATRVEGPTQPIGYLLESYAKGALPPEGLDEFLQQARTTFSQVGDFYQYWLKFQGESLGRLFTDIYTSINPQAAVSNGPRKGPQRVEVVRAAQEPAQNSGEQTHADPAPQSQPEPQTPPMDPGNKPWIERG